MQNKVFELIAEKMQEIRNNFGVKRLGIFGSFSRGEATDFSDVDILVEFEKGEKSFDNFMNLKFYLEDLLGREIDLVTTDALRPELKDEILKEVLYA